MAKGVAWYMFGGVKPSTAAAGLGVAPGKERNFTLMRTLLTVVSLLAQSFGASLFANSLDQAYKSAAEQQLAAQYRLTTVNRGGEIVAAGSVLLLQRNGLLVYSISNPLAPQSTYKNGKISRNPLGGKAFGRDFLNAMSRPGESADIDQRTVAAGAALWVTKMDLQKDGLIFRVYTDPEGGGLYYGELKVPFDKNSLPPADRILSTVAEVMAVQADESAAPTPAQSPDAPATEAIAPPDQPLAPPPTVSLGLTIDRVVAIMGQPERLADLGSRKIYSYKDMKITFLDGKVSDIQ